MSLSDRMAGWVLRTRFGESLAKRVREGLPAFGGLDPDEHLYRRLSGGEPRDLSPLQQERAIRIAYFLYKSNPMAYRLTEDVKNWVVGEGISFEAGHPKVEAVLRKFWHDPVNDWPVKQHSRVLELGLFGEQCYRALVNPADGHVRLAPLDPSRIDRVAVDPENPEVAVSVVRKGSEPEKDRTFRVVHLDEDPSSPSYGRLSGEAFYFAVNKVAGASRGTPDLLALADLLDAYDSYLFTLMERAGALHSYLWDVTLEDFTEEQIREWLRTNPTPKPGSVRAHNQKVKWQAVAPPLGARESAEEARLFRAHILGGAGFAEHWFGRGDEATRATAAEMGEPILKRLRARQQFVRHMIERMIAFALDQWALHNPGEARGVPEGAFRDFRVVLPEPSARDVAQAASALKDAAEALEKAEERGWLAEGEAARAFSLVLCHLGVPEARRG